MPTPPPNEDTAALHRTVTGWRFQLAYACLLLVAVACVFLCLAGFVNTLKAYQSQSWPGAAGIVQSSQVLPIPPLNPGHPPRGYTADVKYTYAVTGKEYQNNLISFRVESNSQTAAQSLVNRYLPDSPVTVYYKASDPKLSVLEPGVSWQVALPGLIGLIIGLPVTLALLRSKPRSSSITPPSAAPTSARKIRKEPNA